MIVYLDCFSGISGDMLLGALLDAGLDLEALRAGLASLPLVGYTLAAEKVTDHSISGTRALVKLDATVPQEHRHPAEIEALIDAAGLPERARERAKAIFRRLGEAEARIHNTSIDEVHFHEVGAVDSIVDIAGVALGFELLGIEEVYCSELPLTSGRVRSEHGPLPVPAPATLELLRDTGAVWRSVAAEGELVTPTGAAVVATLARFERPSLAVRTIGYGFGQRRNLPWANCVRLVLGDAAGAASTHMEESERTPEAF
ncbi:MAG: nickel pincer cofactor biosynthesis protein LarC, partial [Ktedonobacterales bacterium]